MKLFKATNYDTIVAKHPDIAHSIPMHVKEFELDFFQILVVKVKIAKGSSKMQASVRIIRIGKNAWATTYKNGDNLKSFVVDDDIIEVLHDPNLKAEEIKSKEQLELEAQLEAEEKAKTSEKEPKAAKEPKAPKATEEQK